MRFTKMQGIGNDYVYVNCFEETIAHPSEVAVAVSDRHFGIGSDGLILIKPCEDADFEMEMYNADGSRSAMCGNGIRCVGKYVYDHGLTQKTELTVKSGGALKYLRLEVKDGAVSQVRVDMGSPAFAPEQIPVLAEGEGPLLDLAVTAADRTFHGTCVSMGNPHYICRVEDPALFELEKYGPLIEKHALFPERVNAEFITVTDRTHIRMRVWERGTGETMACGTGACAVAVACILNGWTEDEVEVALPGGVLRIRWDRNADTVFMTGPATEVFQGEINV